MGSICSIVKILLGNTKSEDYNELVESLMECFQVLGCKSRKPDNKVARTFT